MSYVIISEFYRNRELTLNVYGKNDGTPYSSRSGADAKAEKLYKQFLDNEFGMYEHSSDVLHLTVKKIVRIPPND